MKNKLHLPFSGRQRRGLAMILSGLATLLLGMMALSYYAQSDPWISEPRLGLSERLEQLKKRFAEESGAFKVVMVGTSRTQCGLDARALEELLTAQLGRRCLVHGLGVSGGGPVSQRIIVQHLFDQGLRPDLLLLEIHPARFWAEGNQPVEMQLAEADHFFSKPCWQLPCLPVNREEEDTWRRLCPEWYGSRLGIVYKLRKSWVPYERKNEDPDMFDAWGSFKPRADLFSTEVCARATAAARREYEDIVRQLSYQPVTVQFLEQTLTLCRQEKVPVALVLLPEGPEFRSWYSAESAQATRVFLEQMSRAWQVPGIHGWEWMEEGEFFDSHHLFREGPRRFTRRLGEEYLIPMCQQ